MANYSHNNWVLQSKVPTATQGVETRTSWLAPFLPRMQIVLQGLCAAHPDTDRYTVAVLGALTEDELIAAYIEKTGERAREKTPDQLRDIVKIDVGMRVPIELVGLYGADRVETLRKPGTREADSRPTGCAWPRNATPHRVRP